MKYAYQGKETEIAKAYGKGLGISTKTSILICKAIRGKNVERAKAILNGAISLKEPIRFTKFNDGVGHRPGMGPGRFPVKACTDILAVLKSAEANAQDKGLSSNLVVEHAAAHMAARSWRYGRQKRRKEKSTHVEIVLKEVAEVKKEKKQAKVETKVVEKKSEEKSVEKKAEPVAEKVAEKPAVKETPKTETKTENPKSEEKTEEKKE